MSPRADTAATIAAAIAAMGPGPLTEEGIARHVAPLFSRVLHPDRPVYLANHSLGRPLDATADDVAEAVGLWQSQLGNAWDAWLAEITAYRARLAALMHAPRADCVVPKTSAGQGLRAILNSYDRPPRVVATRGEFDSIDLILRQYALRKRIELRFVEARADGMFEADELLAAIRDVDLVVVSQVLFNTGQVLPALPALIEAAHSGGLRSLGPIARMSFSAFVTGTLLAAVWPTQNENATATVITTAAAMRKRRIPFNEPAAARAAVDGWREDWPGASSGTSWCHRPRRRCRSRR